MWDIQGIKSANALKVLVAHDHPKITADKVRQIMGAEELHICRAENPNNVLCTLHKTRCNVYDLPSSVIKLNCGETTLTPHINNILVAGETVGISIRGVDNKAWLTKSLATSINQCSRHRGLLSPTSDVC